MEGFPEPKGFNDDHIERVAGSTGHSETLESCLTGHSEGGEGGEDIPQEKGRRSSLPRRGVDGA